MWQYFCRAVMDRPNRCVIVAQLLNVAHIVHTECSSMSIYFRLIVEDAIKAYEDAKYPRDASAYRTLCRLHEACTGKCHEPVAVVGLNDLMTFYERHGKEVYARSLYFIMSHALEYAMPPLLWRCDVVGRALVILDTYWGHCQRHAVACEPIHVAAAALSMGYDMETIRLEKQRLKRIASEFGIDTAVVKQTRRQIVLEFMVPYRCVMESHAFQLLPSLVSLVSPVASVASLYIMRASLSDDMSSWSPHDIATCAVVLAHAACECTSVLGVDPDKLSAFSRIVKSVDTSRVTTK